MVLSVHASIGGAIASVASLNPVSALFAGFISHFLLDAIPHKDYKLPSKKRNEEDRTKDDMDLGKNFLRFDLPLIAFDCLSAFIILAFFSFNTPFFWPIMFGAVGGVLPDFLQFLYFLTKEETLRKIRFFHVNILHAREDLKNGFVAFLQQGLIFLIGLYIVFISI